MTFDDGMGENVTRADTVAVAVFAPCFNGLLLGFGGIPVHERSLDAKGNPSKAVQVNRGLGVRLCGHTG